MFTAKTTGRCGILCKILWTGCISRERAGSLRPRCPRPLLTPPGAATVTRAPLHETHLPRDEAPARHSNSQTRPPAARHGTAQQSSPPPRPPPAPRPPGPASPARRPRRPWRAPRCCCRRGSRPPRAPPAGAAPTAPPPPPPCGSPAPERGGRRRRQLRAVTRGGRAGGGSQSERRPAAGAVLHAGSCSWLPSGELAKRREEVSRKVPRHRCVLSEQRYRALHRITKYPKLKATHKDHWVELLALHRVIPNSHPMCPRVLPLECRQACCHDHLPGEPVPGSNHPGRTFS